jgi:putative heme-binding domain-containing protein
VESVLLPNKQIAEAFRATNVVTTAGQVVTGLVVADEVDRIELLLPDATRRTIPKAQIDEQSRTDTSPMPEGLVRTVAELQDLLAYLLSENPLPP